MINSTVTDFLIRIKNGYKANRKTVDAPLSKLNTALAQILKKYGFVGTTEVEERTMKIALCYDRNEPKLTDIALFSTPGRRVYHKANALPWGKTNNSLIIISTSKGLMSQKEAVKANLGGEVIAEIY